MLLLELTTDKYQVVNDDSVRLGEKTFVQHPADKRSDEKLILMDARLLDHLWKRDRDMYIGPAPNYENHIGNRIENFKQFYENNDTIRVGSAHISQRRQLASFGDGRHRTRVLMEYGYKMIPLSVTQESLDNLDALT